MFQAELQAKSVDLYTYTADAPLVCRVLLWYWLWLKVDATVSRIDPLVVLWSDEWCWLAVL